MSDRQQDRSLRQRLSSWGTLLFLIIVTSPWLAVGLVMMAGKRSRTWVSRRV